MAARPAVVLSPQERELLVGATDEEVQTAAREALWELAKARNVVEMDDGTVASLPDDPDWGSMT